MLQLHIGKKEINKKFEVSILGASEMLTQMCILNFSKIVVVMGGKKIKP